MNILGILLIFLGILSIILGLDISGRIGSLGKLPGDILIQKENFTIYFPIATAISLSTLFALLFFIFHKFLKQ